MSMVSPKMRYLDEQTQAHVVHVRREPQCQLPHAGPTGARESDLLSE
jgi:hypothetical protein